MAHGPAYVVVGAGAAGTATVQQLRESGYAGRLVLLDAESQLPYSRTPLSKAYLRGEVDEAGLLLHDAQWYADRDVELLLGSAAVSLERPERTLVLADGRRLGYERLLLAPGAAARRLLLPGADLTGVHVPRTLRQAAALRGELRRGGRVVVVGAGWTGLECAAAARYAGAHVTVLEAAPSPLHAVLGAEMGGVLADLHRANGVDVRVGVSAAELLGRDGRVRAVATSDGAVLPADVVVAAVGATPETALAERAGLAVDGGIVVDAAMRTADPAVFATGDAARVASTPGWVDHWDYAMASGRVAARSMLDAGGSATEPVALPHYRSEQYATAVAVWGLLGPEGYDEVVVRGQDEGEDDEAQEEFLAFWLREGHVVAALAVNTDSAGVEELVRARARVPAATLADPGVDLTRLLLAVAAR